MLTGLYLPELSDILTAITQSAIIKPGVGVHYGAKKPGMML